MSFFRKGFEWFALKYAVITINIIEYFRLENHVSCINGSSITYIFLTERFNSIITTYIQNTLILCKFYCSQSGKLTMRLMEFNKFCDVNVTDTITIGKKKWFVADIFLYALDASTCHCIIASVNDGDFPRLAVAAVDGHLVLVVTVVEGNVGIMEYVVTGIMQLALKIESTLKSGIFKKYCGRGARYRVSSH